MHKTISINIGGMFFQIDEQAYMILEAYLESLKNHFAATEGKEEIIQDIEARIAEIFQTKIEAGQVLISQQIVDETINILGKPRDMDNRDSEQEAKQETKKTTKKRLFRDEENHVLGGVCSGLGHYLDVDPVWFRLGFVIGLIFFASSILVYLVLWIIIPKALSMEDKMNMKGSPMTISEIEHNIKNEFEDLKTRFHTMKGKARRHGKKEIRDFKQKMKEVKQEAKYSCCQKKLAASVMGYPPDSHRRQGVGSVFGEIIYYFLRALLIFTGIVLLIIAIVLTASLVLSLTASDSFLFFTKWGISSVSLPALSNMFFENSWQQQLAVVSLILLIGVPLLMLIFNSIRMIIGFRTKIRIVSVTASLIWLTGLILAIFLTINIIGNFNEKSTVKQEVMLPQPKETLTIDVKDNLPNQVTTHFVDDENIDVDINKHERFVFSNFYLLNNGTQFCAYGFPKLKIIPSETDAYKLTVVKFSRGTTIMNARNRAEVINMNVIIADSTVSISNYFLLPYFEKWRNQSVKLVLEVPEGKSIFMTKRVENLIYDRDNVDGSWNLDMIGKKMTMKDGKLIENSEIQATDTIPQKQEKKELKVVVKKAVN